jgi:hypothetical protein
MVFYFYTLVKLLLAACYRPGRLLPRQGITSGLTVIWLK